MVFEPYALVHRKCVIVYGGAAQLIPENTKRLQNFKLQAN